MVPKLTCVDKQEKGNNEQRGSSVDNRYNNYEIEIQTNEEIAVVHTYK